MVRTLCTNRDLPLKLQKAGDDLAFDWDFAGPIAGVRRLRAPTTTLRPRSRRGAHWKLISHLSLNHLSLTDPVEGRAARCRRSCVYTTFRTRKAGASWPR